MSHEIRHNPGVSGRNYWAELYNESKNVWDTSTNTFRDELVVTPAHRAIVMSDLAGSGKYWADLPEVSAGVGYQWFVRRQATGSPAIGDAIELVGDIFNWDGLRVYGAADVILVNGATFTLLSTLDGVVVYNRSPVSPDHLDIYKADYYSTTDGTGRTLSFTFDGSEPWPDTLLECHFYCTPTAKTLDATPSAVGLDAVDCTVDVGTGSGRKVTLTLTSTQTDTLTSGVNAYTFGVVANKSTHRAVLRSGTMTVRPDPAG